MSAQQRLMLGYQLNDIFTQVSMGTNPLMIAAQQGPQITQIFGGLKATLARIPTPALVAGGAALGALAGVSVLHSLAELNDALQLQERRFTTLLGSQTEAKAAYRDIATFASDAGISIGAAGDKFVTFAKATESLGASRQNIADVASAAEKLTQLSGANDKEGGAAQDALAGMFKQSTVNAEQLRTVLSNVPQIAQKIADGLGVSVTQLRLMALEGDLSNKQVFDALLKQTDAVNSEFAKMPKSIGSTFTSLGDDLGQLAIKLANNLPIIKEYRLVIEAAAAAAKSLNKGSVGETPEQVVARTVRAGAFDAPDKSGTSERQAATAAGQLVAQKEFSAAIAKMQADFEEKRGAAEDASIKAVASDLEKAMAIAGKFDPIIGEMKELQRQSDDVTKGLDALQGSFAHLDTATATQDAKRLADTLQFLRDKSLEAKTAYGQALDEVTTRQQQNELGMTPGQRSYTAQVKQLATSQMGVSTADAQTVVDQKQLQMLDDLIAKEARELIVQTAITGAMRNGKKATDDMAVAMQILGITMDQLGKTSEEIEVRLDVLAETMGKVREQARTQATIEASKPLTDELEGIAAAMKVVEQGAYAMKRAEAAAIAARNDSGTGDLQMEVFDKRQALNDANIIKTIQDEVDLTNKLAAAAGDVAKQKKIQLDYDIKRAQMASAPAAAGQIDEKMRADFAAKQALSLADGAAEMEKQLVLTKEETGLIQSGSADYAAQLAMLQKKRELLSQGADIEKDASAQRQIALAGEQARADRDKQLAQDAADATKRTWQNAFDGIQSAGADAFYNMFTQAGFNAKSVADAMKQIFFRTFAEIAAAAVIRPLIQPIFAAGQSAGIIPNGVGGTYGLGGGGGIGMPSFGGGGITSSLSNWQAPNWLGGGNPFGFLGQPIMGAEALNSASMTASLTNTPMSFGSSLGSTTWGAGLGAAAGLGLGAFQLATAKNASQTIGGISSMIGAGVSLIPGIGQIAGPLIALAGNFLPGLLGIDGEKKPPKLMATGGLNFNAGAFNYSGSQYNGGSSLAGPLGSTGNTMKMLLDASGVTSLASSNSLNYQTLSQGDFKNATTFVNGKQWGQSSEGDAGLDTAAAHVAHQIMMEAGSGISDMMRQGLGNYGLQNLDHAFSTQELGTAVSELKAFETATKDLGRTITPAETALKGIDDQFKSLTDSATKYGLDTTKIDAEQTKQRTKVATDFADGIQRALDDQNGDTSKGLLADLDKEKQAAIDNNTYIVANVAGALDQINAIEDLYGKKRADIVKAAADAALQAAADAQQKVNDLWQSNPGLARTEALFTAHQAFAGQLSALNDSTTALGANPMTTQIKGFHDEQNQFMQGTAATFGVGSPEYYDATIASYKKFDAEMKATNDNFRAGLDAMSRELEGAGVANIKNMMDARAKDIATATALDGPYFDGILRVGDNVVKATKAWNAKIFAVADDFKYSVSQGLLAFTNPLQAQINDNNKARDEAMATAKANNAAVTQVYAEVAARAEAIDNIRTNDLYAIKYTNDLAATEKRALTESEALNVQKWSDEIDAAKAAAATVDDVLGATGNHYVEMADITELYLKKEQQLKEQYYAQAISGLQDLIKRITYGDLSGASSITQFTGAQASYSATRAQAFAGDQTGLDNFSAAAGDFLTAARDYFAYTPEYFSLLEQIKADAAELNQTLSAGNTPSGGELSPDVKALMDALQRSNAANDDKQRTIDALVNKLTDTNSLLQRIAVNGR